MCPETRPGSPSSVPSFVFYTQEILPSLFRASSVETRLVTRKGTCLLPPEVVTTSTNPSVRPPEDLGSSQERIDDDKVRVQTKTEDPRDRSLHPTSTKEGGGRVGGQRAETLAVSFTGVVRELAVAYHSAVDPRSVLRTSTTLVEENPRQG